MARYELSFPALGDFEPLVAPGTQIKGTSGDDILWGTGGQDAIYGYGGHDWLTGNGGPDYLDGGPGIDSAFYDDSTVWVLVDLATGRGSFGSAEGDTLVSIENVYGSYYGDIIRGNEGNNDLYGLSGIDILYGGGGVDGLEGGEGNDILEGGAGADWLDGGNGDDTVNYSSSPATVFPLRGFVISWGVTVDLSANLAYWGDAEGDTFSGIENVWGSRYNDTLTGTDGPNTLHGSDGNDLLSGLGGDDVLEGDAGIDTMIGGPGSDSYVVDNAGDAITEAGGQGNDTVYTLVSYTLTAGADVETLRISWTVPELAEMNLTGNANGNVVIGHDGNNVISGGDGRDELTGLGGQDSFLFDTALDATFNIDVITDFNVADDTIWLDDDIFSSGLTANNSVAGSQFVIGPAALDAGDRIIYNNATGAVLYDSDGTGSAAAVQFAQLSAGLPLTNFDFFVVA
jgi:Ca2+-binding RTX toxin-like protein